MDQSIFNIDNIVTSPQGLKVVEEIYINPVAEYLLGKRENLGFNNNQFTKSYSYAYFEI